MKVKDILIERKASGPELGILRKAIKHMSPEIRISDSGYSDKVKNGRKIKVNVSPAALMNIDNKKLEKQIRDDFKKAGFQVRKVVISGASNKPQPWQFTYVAVTIEEKRDD